MYIQVYILAYGGWPLRGVLCHRAIACIMPCHDVGGCYRSDALHHSGMNGCDFNRLVVVDNCYAISCHTKVCKKCWHITTRLCWRDDAHFYHHPIQGDCPMSDTWNKQRTWLGWASWVSCTNFRIPTVFLQSHRKRHGQRIVHHTRQTPLYLI